MLSPMQIDEIMSHRVIRVQELLEAKAEDRPDIEKQFFLHLRMRNGLFKATHPHRLDDTFEMLIFYVKKIQDQPIKILDVGCSTGITTIELHEALKANNIFCKTIGTDLMTKAIYVRRKDGRALLFDLNGQAIQVELGDWAMSWTGPPRRIDYLLKARKVFLSLMLTKYQSHTFWKAIKESTKGFDVRTLSLVASQANSVTDLLIEEEDVLNPRLPGKFHLIRAANLLNRSALSDHDIKMIVNSIRSRLVEDGLFFVVRTINGINKGTLYNIKANIFKKVDILNGGIDIADLIEAI